MDGPSITLRVPTVTRGHRRRSALYVGEGRSAARPGRIQEFTGHICDS